MNSSIFVRLVRAALLFCLVLATQAATVDLVSGPYSGCPGSGCAKGDYKFGSNASTSSGSFTITAPSGAFTSSDVGKRGVTMDWAAPNVTGGSCWSGYACFSGKSCQFTVSGVSSSTSIQVSPVAGCGSSGVGFTASGNAYWAVYSDDSTALHNAVTAASGGTLTVPGSYKGGIYTGTSIPASTTISCSAGASFWDPKLNSATTYMFTPGSHVTIQGCTLRGTEPSSGAYYDVLREYNIFIGVFGVDGVLLQNNTFLDSWGTYMVGTSGASNWHVTNNIFRNCGVNAIQTNKTGGTNPGTVIDHNTVENCDIDGEDATGATGTPNKFQTFDHNYVYITGQGGSGYYRTQTAKGLSYTSSASLSVGVAASGGRPYAGEYSGVTISNNTVCGLHSKLMPCPGGGCNYTTLYGQTLTNNTCNNGCNNTPVTGACPIVAGGGGGGGGTGGTPPVIQSFTANPQTIDSGNGSTLSWSVQNATTESINQGIGTVTGTSKVVSPTATTGYTLTAGNATGSSTASTTVTVNGSGGTGSPVITGFSCSPNPLTAGASTTCTWTVTGQTSLSIDQGIGTVSGTSKILTPPETTQYKLTAANSSGTSEKYATVNVVIAGSFGTSGPASWPTVATTRDLFQARDHAKTTLANPVTANATSLDVTDASVFSQYQVVTVDSQQVEILAKVGNTLLVSAPLAGTTAPPHAKGAIVAGRITALYHNQLVAELKALEASFALHPYGTYPGTATGGAAWPAHPATEVDLFAASDGADTETNGATTSSAASVLLAVQSFFVPNEIIQMDSELIHICSLGTYSFGWPLNVCSGGRGFDGTVAASHGNSAQVTAPLASAYHNQLALEISHLEADLWGTAGSTSNCPCTAISGASWPNHAATLDELLIATPGQLLTAQYHNRLVAEIIALETDINANPQ